MSLNYTPGPWEVKKTVINPGAILERTATLITAGGFVVCNVFNVPTETCMSADENATLIAAAPELLEVAQNILADDLLPYLPAEYIAKVRAAIAKATGCKP